MVDPRDVANLTVQLARDRTLLMLHGLLLFQVGAAILLYGGPAAGAELLGEHSHQILGLTAMLPGATLLVGMLGDYTDVRHWMRVIGIAGVVVWESCFAILFILTGSLSQDNPLIPLQGDPEPMPGHPYVPIVYFNVALLALVHLVTLLRLGPPGRLGRR